jgi:hypothetical protein
VLALVYLAEERYINMEHYNKTFMYANN